MTRDDITRMARQCGWAKVGREMEYPVLTARLERFAALVADAKLRRLYEVNAELLNALHCISLAAQDSGSTKEGMGLYARAAVAKAGAKP